jgi:co-chaperonin GroES (HSP10)
VEAVGLRLIPTPMKQTTLEDYIQRVYWLRGMVVGIVPPTTHGGLDIRIWMMNHSIFRILTVKARQRGALMPEILDEIKKEALKGIKPLGNSVYIYVLPHDSKIGSIVMPSAHAQRTEEAFVIAKGKDVEELEVGDKILINYKGGAHIQLSETYSNEPRHRIIIEHNILAKVEK